MSCINSTCQCNYTSYFLNNACGNKFILVLIISLNCFLIAPKKPYNSACTSFVECQDYNGHTCSSSSLRCICNSN